LLLSVVVLMTVASAAQASTFGWSGTQAATTLRQSDQADEAFPTPGDADGDGVADESDQCPAQFGGEGAAAGCPDADDDGVPDTADKCPQEVAGTGDGCFAIGLKFNAYLPRTVFEGICNGKGCTIAGTAVVTVSSAIRRKLHLSSALIGRFGFTRRCGFGVCADLKPSALIVKKLKADERHARNSGPGEVIVPVKVSFEMTSPRNETLVGTYRFGLGTNGGQYRLCGAGFPDRMYQSPACGGKDSGEEGDS
jgi:hypothetical protein